MLSTSLIHGESADTALLLAGTNRGDRTLLVSSTGLEQAKKLISSYKQNHIPDMNEKSDSGLTYCNIDTGEPVLLPFRMSCYVVSNLVVTAGMLTPGLKVSDPLH
jgi:sideroflexin-5